MLSRLLRSNRASCRPGRFEAIASDARVEGCGVGKSFTRLAACELKRNVGVQFSLCLSKSPGSKSWEKCATGTEDGRTYSRCRLSTILVCWHGYLHVLDGLPASPSHLDTPPKLPGSSSEKQRQPPLAIHFTTVSPEQRLVLVACSPAQAFTCPVALAASVVRSTTGVFLPASRLPARKHNTQTFIHHSTHIRTPNMGGLLLHYDDSTTSGDDEMQTPNGEMIAGSSAATSSANLASSFRYEDYEEDEDDEIDELLRQWRATITVKPTTGALSMADFITFFSRALTLVDSGEEPMATVFRSLASSSGLIRLRELLDRNFDDFSGAKLFAVWDQLLLVYLKILSRPAVLESDVVDTYHGTLMNDLLGEQGKRAASVFRTAVRSLLVETEQKQIGPRTHQENIETCITILSRIVCSTDITPELRAVTESMVSLLETPFLDKKTNWRVHSIRESLAQPHTAQNGTSTPPDGVEAPKALPIRNDSATPAGVNPPAPPVAMKASLLPPRSIFKLRKPNPNKSQSKVTSKIPSASTTAASQSAPTAVICAPVIAAQVLTHDSSSPTFNRHSNDKEHIIKIQILPTHDEMMSDKAAYLPREDPSTWHKSGLPGLIDRHFRLVREDTVGQLRIAVKIQLKALQNPNPTPKPAGTHFTAFDSENQGARTNVYHDVALDRVLFDAQKGLQFILTVSQQAPSHLSSADLRDRWWRREQRLEPGSLICLLSADGAAHFLSVHNPPPLKPGQKPNSNPNELHKRYNRGAQRDRAFVIAELASTNPKDASALLRTLATKSTKVRRCLIEFPGQILQSFVPTLAALQIMAKQSHNIPFADALTPDFENFEPSPPAYSEARGFQYQLQTLLPEDERMRSARSRDSARLQSMDSVLKRSVLDEVQQDAVKHALTNELALIQGPPGTGKSFTGVKLIEALLENRAAADLGPIVCVCFTNHALDQLLEHLMDAGVDRIIRMGSRSKSERLAPLNIREVAKNYPPEKFEGAQLGRAGKHIKRSVPNFRALLERWQSVVNEEDTEIITVLERDYPARHAQLKTGNTVRGHFARSPIQEWLHGGLNAHTEAQTSGPMFSMSNAERKAFHRELLDSVLHDLYAELEHELQEFHDHRGVMDAMRGEADLRALSNADVVGMTTSGLAGKYKRLRKLGSKVVVVEEAGEVLEAHLLTAMLPSVEHTILIGDHQQLRPKVNNYDLSIDNPCSKITLDVSLFERLVSPRFDGSPGLPFVTLEKQRRMHPSVSHLIRQTLYPNLGDADNVKTYPPVAGMAKRLFWLDHRNKEDDSRNNPQSNSQSNRWEVEMVAALLGHLHKQGVYSAGDIAVLTPYQGQVKLFQEKLGGTFGIMLSERDIDDGLQATGSRGRLMPIRLSTVDAFQGEEAKVVIISMVRSNDKKLCGFLGTTNRINVLLSRAMHGMYIIGNSYTTSEIPMWQKVASMFKAEGNFGRALEIACSRHPGSQAPIEVSEPRGFSRVSLAAGCNAECGEQLPCGHRCSDTCHSEAVHNQVKCKQQCNRAMPNCEHVCEKSCEEACEQNCKVMLPCELLLPCGHHLTEMCCFQQHQEPSKIRCKVEVERYVPGCGHMTKVACYISENSPRFYCRETCATPLNCGHACERLCAECRPQDRGDLIVKEDHGSCLSHCGREYSDCNHKCLEFCHGAKPCPPCTATCQPDCAHLTKKRCDEPSPPCTKESCSAGCPHSACSMPCAVPCDLIPCSKPCKEKLKCGHQCPSICGEVCPTVDFCRRCAKDAIKSQVVDPSTQLSYEDVDEKCLFLPCGHIFTVEALDRHMDMAAYYEMEEYRDKNFPVALDGDILPLSYDKPKGCPACGCSLSTLSRYGRITRGVVLAKKFEKFFASADQYRAPLALELQRQKQILSSTIGQARLVADINLGDQQTTPASNPYLSVLRGTGNRYQAFSLLRIEVRKLMEKVQREELPFIKVRNLAEAAGRRTNAEFELDENIMQTGSSLLSVQALLVRCDLAISADLVALWQSKRVQQQKTISVNFTKNRQDCDTLLTSAVQSKDILHQAEAHILWAQFLALDCAARSHEAKM